MRFIHQVGAMPKWNILLIRSQVKYDEIHDSLTEFHFKNDFLQRKEHLKDMWPCEHVLLRIGVKHFVCFFFLFWICDYRMILQQQQPAVMPAELPEKCVKHKNCITICSMRQRNAT